MKTKRSALFAFLLIIFISFTHPQAPAIEWQHCYGGTNGEEGYSIKATPDGGYIVAGRTDSYDGDVRGGYGGYDCWILKIDNTGTIQWQTVLGGMHSEEPKEISLTSDGGYVVAGYSQSNEGDVSGHHGTTNNSDVWVVKIDNNGNVQWQKSYGGTLDDYGKSIEQTTDGGYIVTGFTNSDDGDVAGYHNTNFGTFDGWVLKLSASGNIQWQKCLGGSMDDLGYVIRQTPDGGYIFTGAAASVDGDINPLQHHGFTEDYWVVKLDPAGKSLS